VKARRRGLLLATGLLEAALLAMACQWGPVELPAPRSWREFQDPALHVALDVPANFVARPVPDGTSFSIPDVGTFAVLRSAAIADEERHHLFVHDTPLGTAPVAGIAAEHFRYRHYDGPFYCVSDAFVVPHAGKRIALEFRTARAGGGRREIGEAMKHRMLASFRFTD
jgi:hypothetical protein